MFKWLFGGKERSGGGGDANESRELFSLSRRLDTTPERAFAVFVDQIGDWWPRDFTLTGPDFAAMRIEARYGGRGIEARRDGGTVVWAKVLTIDRPNHIVLAWQIRPDREPEPEEAVASRLDVRFIAAEGGKTDVLVVHRDFPRHGEGWEKYKADMAKRWPGLLDAYAKAVGAG